MAIAGLIQRLGFLYLCLTALVAVCFVGFTNDTNVLMFHATYLLKGGKPYADWIEINPPLIFILYALPAFLMEYAAVPPAIALHGATLLAITVSLKLCSQVINGTLWRHDVALGGPALLWIIACILIVLPFSCSVFADREHLFFIFTLPWLLTRLQGTEANARISIWAGIGFCIKPYNALLFIVVALVSAACRKAPWQHLLCRSDYIIAGVGLGYILLVVTMFPEYFTVISLGQITYDTIKVPNAVKIVMPAMALVTFIIIWYKSPLQRKPIWVAFFSSCMVIYLLNGGWRYTWYLILTPLLFIALVSLHRSYAGIIKDNPLAVVSPLAIVAILVFAHVVFYKDIKSTYKTGYAHSYHHLPKALLADLKDKAGDRFIWLGTQLWASNIADLQTAPRHVYAYEWLWLLPWLMAHPDHPQKAFVSDMLWKPLARSLKEYPDATVVIDVSPLQRQIGGPVSLKAQAEQHVEVKKLFEHYQLSDHVDTCHAPYLTGMCSYEFWRRKPATSNKE